MYIYRPDKYTDRQPYNRRQNEMNNSLLQEAPPLQFKNHGTGAKGGTERANQKDFRQNSRRLGRKPFPEFFQHGHIILIGLDETDDQHNDNIHHARRTEADAPPDHCLAYQ